MGFVTSDSNRGMVVTNSTGLVAQITRVVVTNSAGAMYGVIEHDVGYTRL